MARRIFSIFILFVFPAGVFLACSLILLSSEQAAPGAKWAALSIVGPSRAAPPAPVEEKAVEAPPAAPSKSLDAMLAPEPAVRLERSIEPPKPDSPSASFDSTLVDKLGWTPDAPREKTAEVQNATQTEPDDKLPDRIVPSEVKPSAPPPPKPSEGAAPLPAAAAIPAATLDAMIGQMIMVGFTGSSADDEEVTLIRQRLAKSQIGGVMLLDRNLENPSQVRALTQSLLASGAPHVPLIAADQEGGAIQRLGRKRGFRAMPSAKAVAATRTPEQAGATFDALAKDIAQVGVNVNFGPVVDLDLNPANPIIGKLGRSFGADPARVTDYARAFVAAHKANGVLTAIKHFPGHGGSLVDSHKSFTDVSATWRESELEPFRALAQKKEGVDMVMVGHLFHPKFTDGGKAPASLSREAIQYWLREKVGFDGVVITDDLNMGAIEQHYKAAQAAVQAIQAGEDIVLFSNYPDYDPLLPEKVHLAIKTKALADKDFEKRVTESYRRIVRMKSVLAAKARAASAPVAAAPKPKPKQANAFTGATDAD